MEFNTHLFCLIPCPPFLTHSSEWWLNRTRGTAATQGIFWTVWDPVPLIFFDNAVCAKSTALRFVLLLVCNVFVTMILKFVLRFRIQRNILKIHSKSDGWNFDFLRTEKVPFCPSFPSTPMNMNTLFETFSIHINGISSTHSISNIFEAVLIRFAAKRLRKRVVLATCFSKSAENCSKYVLNGVRGWDFVYMDVELLK